MTPTQFAALARLLRSRQGPSERAARLILCDGIKPSESARQSGVAPASASNAVTRYRKAYELALIVAADAPVATITEQSVISDAIRTEREACAALCDWHAANYATDTRQLTYKAASNAAQWLAKAIRARSSTNGA